MASAAAFMVGPAKHEGFEKVGVEGN